LASDRAKRHRIGQVTIFSDAQAAISRMVSDEPEPGQKHALQAREQLRSLHRTEPGIRVEIRRRQATKG
jgi:hypothetical protein